jgi:hypothetical protein
VSATVTFKWVGSSCDACGTAGLEVLVPEFSDGSVKAKELPSLCKECLRHPAKKAWLEERARDEEHGIVLSPPWDRFCVGGG